MHTATHPEKEERAIINQVLREQLRALRDSDQWSNNKLAKSLGCNAAYVQQYIDGEFPGDLVSFERKLDDFFANESRRRASGVEATECDDSKQMKTAFEYIRKTNDFGTLIAPSGEGKTRGIELYVAQNPLTILYRTTVWSADKKSVEGALFDTVGRAGYDGQTKYAVHLVKRLRGSDRFIIVDDAHKLNRQALQWFFDFHEATQCPVCVLGTLELLDKLEDDTQRFSRTGYYEEIKRVDAKGALIVDRGLIKHMVKQLAPDANGEAPALCDLAEQVAAQHGVYRSVHKQLKLAAEIKAGSSKLTWEQSFRAAHTKLIRNYKLA